MGRSSKAFRNVMIGLGNKVILMVFAFGTRTLFVRLLGAEYTGVSSLFTNILSLLSLAELGIGNVFMFYLYGALKKGEKEETAGLVREFRNIYYGIIACVVVVGIAIIPFLKVIVRSDLNSQDLMVYYLLYLGNSVASYFAIYRTMVLSADQKNYIINICSTVSAIVMYIVQLIYLVLCRDFFGYLVIQLLTTVISNLILNTIACKKYPYLKKKGVSHIPVVKKRELLKNIKATFLYKISDTILDQTDNIIISIMFGTVFVGYYSNYYMIILYLCNFAGIIANGMVASFGNLNVEGDKEHSYSMFRASMLLFAIIGTYFTACYAAVIQDFIPLWVGRQYLMGYGLVIAVLTVFYLRMITNTMWMYRSSMGLFKEVQYVNLIAALFNIILAVILGKLTGLAGVIAATAVSRLVTSFWFEGEVLFKRFEKSVRIYYIQQLKDFAGAVLMVGISFGVSRVVPGAGMLGMIVKLVLCTGIVAFGELLLNGNTKEFKVLMEKVRNAVKERKGGNTECQ